MKRLRLLWSCLIAACLCCGITIDAANSVAATDSTLHPPAQHQKIIFIRHAEKPPSGLGQLNCQGLNRALKLPSFFSTHYPKPDFIFAPNPAIAVLERYSDNQYHDYVRPLVTIEPTAIQLGLPVNTQIGFDQSRRLVDTLLEDQYHNAVVIVVWEHAFLLRIAQTLLTHFKQPTSHVPKDWSNDDFNTMFVFDIDWQAKPTPTLAFSIEQERIDHLAKHCPA